VLASFATTLEHALDASAARHPNPGRLETFHRLNRAEYRNAIRDVLGVEVAVDDLVPQDETSYGFDNNAGVLRLSHTFVERYASAATKIARLALGSPAIPSGEVTTLMTSDLSQESHQEGLPLGTRGGTVVRHWVPLDAEYELTIKLLSNQGEYNEPAFDEPHTIELSIDGERRLVHTYKVQPKSARRGFGFGPPPPGEEGPGEARVKYEGLKTKLTLSAGPHDIIVAFPKKSQALSPYNRDWFAIPFFSGVGSGLSDTMHAPALGSITIAGPFNPTGPGDTPSRRQILTCVPTGPADEARCAQRILSSLARKAYRRTTTPAEVQLLMDFFERGRAAEQGGFERGLELAVQRLLVSPEFLFRIERDPNGTAPGTDYRLDDFALASRLSFFLWSSVPDEALLTAAQRGTLKDPKVLASQVRRMISDSKSQAFVSNFTGQWLYLRNVPRATIDTASFPDFESGLRRAYATETQMFFRDLLDAPTKSAMEFLRADYTFVNESLARHYGIPAVFGEYFRKVPMTGGRPGGLLGHGSVLMATSYANRTAPTIRGKFILGTFLGTPPPDPPPNIPALRENQVGTEVGPQSVRERLAEHRRNPACAGCHNLMDPLGLALENFDAVGRWRAVGEDGAPIDASVVLFDGSTLNGPADLRNALAKREDNFLRTLTGRLMTYALGRGVLYYDEPTIRRIAREADSQSLQSIILGIVMSDPFQKRRAAL
jgi:hypothetical protein